MTALDYSTARPGGAALAAAGVTAVGRYLAGDPNYAGGLGPAELADLRAHGIDVWVNYEGTNTGMLGGYQAGVAHGQKAAANLKRLGIPVGSQVVYASADFDVQPSQFAACDAYLDGFSSVLGPPAVIGIYGNMPYINHCRQTGKATWFWQSMSKAFTHGQTGFVHIQQTTDPSLPDTDHNILHAAVYGQIGASPADLNANPFNQGADMPLDANTDYPAFAAMLYRALKWDVRDGNQGVGADAAHGATMWDLLHGLANTLASNAKIVPTLTDAQMQTLEAAVVAGINQSGVTLPQAERDAIATAVRTQFVSNPLK